MQVEACVHISDSHWAAACSSLTGTSWHGGLSVFKTGSPFVTTYQWLCNEGGVTSIDALRKHSVLATGCMSGQVHIHSLNDDFHGTLVNTIDAHQGPVSATAFNPSGELHAFSLLPVLILSSLLSASHDCKLNVYEIVESGEETLVRSVLGHYKPILAAVWANESSFVSGGRDGSVKLWDTRVKTGEETVVPGKPVWQISGRQQSYALTCKGDEVVVGEEDGISFYDLRKETEPVARIAPPVKAVSFSGNLLVIGSDDGQTKVVDVSQQNKTIYSAKHTDFVRAVAWNSEEEKREYMSGGWGVLDDGALDVKLHIGF